MRTLKVVLLAVALVVFAEVNRWAVLNRVAVAALVLILIAYLWSRTSLRGISVTRELVADRTQVGQPAAERLEVRNASRIGKLWLEIRDYSTLPGHQASRVLRIGGRTRAVWPVESSCMRRGRFRLGPLVLRAGDPFGLFPVSVSVEETRELIVYPATVDVSGFPLPAGALAGGPTTDRRSPFMTPSVASVRDYAPGDAFNRISWGATARTGRLMVKEFEFDPTADLWLVLDLEERHNVRATRALDLAPNARGEWPIEVWLDSTEEYAVTIAASLANLSLRQGRNVGLIASASHHEVIAADRSDRQLVKILESLAVVHADGQQPLAEVLLAEGNRFTRHSSVVIVTSSTDEAWVPALLDIVGRRIRVSVIMVEPDTFGTADSSLLIVSSLLAAGIPTHLVKYGDDIAAALSSTRGSGRGVGGKRRG